MAKTLNLEPIPQNVNNDSAIVPTGSGEVKQLLFTAGAEDAIVSDVLVQKGANARVITLFYYDGTTYQELHTETIASGSGTINLLDNSPLSLDRNGNKSISIKATHKLYIAGSDVADTNDVVALGWDY